MFSKLFFVVFILILSSITYGQNLVFEYSFDVPSIVHDGQADNIEINGLSKTRDAGMPMLPFKQIKLFIPDDLKVLAVKTKRVDSSQLFGLSALRVSGENFYNFNERVVLVNDLKIDESYPAIDDEFQVQLLHGHQILIKNIFPVYVDKTKKIFNSTKIRIEIECEKNKKLVSKRFSSVVKAKIDNPNDVKSFSKSNTIEKSDYDYLIVTTSELLNYKGENSLYTFKKYLETNRNLKVKMVDIVDVLNKSSANSTTKVDSAASLRNFIKNEYDKHGISFLLIAGDSDGWYPKIPVRKLRSAIRAYLNGRWFDATEDIPSDFYYGCLDGSFNSDNDEIWGEANDGENGQDVDFLCELTVGRWPTDKIKELQPIVKKTILAYNLNQREKIVGFAGELLFRELNLWGGDYMDQHIGVIDDHGFISNGFDSSWTMKKFYEKQKMWDSYDIRNFVEDENPLIIYHLGHSSSSMNMKFRSYRYRGLNNLRPYFYYSQGCHAATFTNNDSIIEKMIYSKGGPFAAVANSSYGLGPEDPEFDDVRYPGTSQILHRYFTNRLLTDEYLSFGTAHQKSKEDILRYINFQEARWVIWAANYFGDPALRP